MLITGSRVNTNPTSTVQIINQNLAQAQAYEFCFNAFEDFISLLEHDIFGTSILQKPTHSSVHFIQNAVDVYMHAIPTSYWTDILGAVYRTWGTDMSLKDLDQALLHNNLSDDILAQINKNDDRLTLTSFSAGTGEDLLSSCYHIEKIGGMNLLEKVEITAMDHVQIRAQICSIQIITNFVVGGKVPSMACVYYGDLLHENNQVALLIWKKK